MEADPPPIADQPNLRWFQYRLRSLFVLITVIAVIAIACSWLTIMIQSRSQPLPSEIMLPGAPKTARNIEAFRSLHGTLAMVDVVRQCGLPDAQLGSGIYIFVYRLQDGTTVSIGTSDLKTLCYVRHTDHLRKITPLIPEPSD